MADANDALRAAEHATLRRAVEAARVALEAAWQRGGASASELRLLATHLEHALIRLRRWVSEHPARRVTRPVRGGVPGAGEGERGDLHRICARAATPFPPPRP